jgi:type I restriction enzyme S subunit
MSADWTTRRLGDVAEIRVSNVDKKTYPGQLPVRLCNYMDAYTSEYLDDERSYMVATASGSELSRFGLQRGDVVITKDSESPDDIAVAALVDADVKHLVCGYHLAILRPRTGVSGAWLLKQLRHEPAMRHFGCVATGSTRYGLSNESIAACPIPIAPPGEQSVITEILRTLDEAIRKTEQVIAKLQQVKQGLLHDLLTRGIDEHGELRDPDRHPEQFKDSELGRVPRAWEVTTIGGVFSIQSGLSLGPHRRPTSRSVAYLRVGNVFRGRIDFSDVARFDATSAELAERRIEAGDLLVVEGHANVDEIGRVARADDRAQGMTFQNHLFRLRSVRAESRFSELFLNCQMVRSYWRRVCSTSSGLNTINQSLLRGVPFLLPPEGEQVRIVAAETATSARIVGLLNELAKLQSLKSGLMHDLLTGRVRTAPHER